ncbi:transporter [Gillisia sp. Hel_I_29]|uniref:transporter n=1 Tax=Gillisia sp. Hel_I_29 TaxID=1249975 RepID=UPI00054E46F7|nr:transporter [Gillisia sp. Hel_I_29]
MRKFSNKNLQLLIFTFLGITANAQYTETINSNRPGNSQGAFSVGTGVLQLEAGGYYGNDNHEILGTDTNILGTDYELRYGFLFEALEINLSGSFQAETTTIKVGANDVDYKRSNFRNNTLGIKYLIFDPLKSITPDKVDIRSWKNNQKFKWKTLIPAVSAYAGANFYMKDNPFLYEGEGQISPKFALITQNNWRGGWVLVMNFIADKMTEDFPTFQGIITLTHAFTPQFAGFIEYNGLISDIYADDLGRLGAAYLISDDFQVDISGLMNFKDTPSRWQVAAGISYRLDMHKKDEFLDDSFEGSRRRKRTEEMQNKAAKDAPASSTDKE